MNRLSHLTLSVLLLLSGAALGQMPRPSHEFDPNDAPPKDISKLLDARRNNRGKIDPELLRNILKNLPRDLDPTQFDEATIKRFLEDNPALRDPKNLERLGEIAKQQMHERPSPEDPKVDWKNLRNTLRMLEDFQKKNPVDPMNPVDPAVDPIEPKDRDSPPPPTPKKPDKQTENLAKWLTKSFGDSPAMRDSLNDLAKIMSQDGKGGRGSDFLTGLGKEWKSLMGSDGKGGDTKSTASKITDLVSNLKLPDLGSGSGKSSRSSSSSSSGPNNSGSPSNGPSFFDGFGGGSWAPVIAFALVAVAGVSFWFLYLRPRSETDAVEGANKRLLPVPPERIETRADVVRAFEYLSLSKCGEEALNWHHRQIADEMGGEEPDRRQAAGRLASLYEKARYAPANELFDETEIAEARARFQQIQGVPSA